MNKAKIGRLAMMIFILALFFVLFLGWWYHNHKIQKAYLERQYWYESMAFAMNPSSSYQDFSYVSVNYLNIYLASYCYENEYADITIEDVKEFLSSEYDEKGKCRALNPPQIITEYIDWYKGDGEEFCKEYSSWLIRFNISHEDKYGDEDFSEMDEDLLLQMINDFNTCPEKDIYKDETKFFERYYAD